MGLVGKSRKNKMKNPLAKNESVSEKWWGVESTVML